MCVAFANGGESELHGLHKVCLNQRVFVSVRACMFLHAHTHTHTHTHTRTQPLPLTHTLPPSVSAPPQDLLLSCRLCTQIASEIGAFGIAPAELVDMMAGTRITLNTDIGSYTRAFAGECSR